MNDAINKALKRCKADGKIRFVYATYTRLVIDFKPAPFKRHCYMCNPEGTVTEIKASVCY